MMPLWGLQERRRDSLPHEATSPDKRSNNATNAAESMSQQWCFLFLLEKPMRGVTCWSSTDQKWNAMTAMGALLLSLANNNRLPLYQEP